MLNTVDVARYFISKDIDGSLFNKELMEREGRKFYSGNARLNKYLQLAQNIYIAKTGKPLMDATFYAYDNGAVEPRVRENYVALLSNRNNFLSSIPEEERVFLDKFYKAFEHATIEELIELSHEDVAWQKKHRFYNKCDQKMDTTEYTDEYIEQYGDMVKILDTMEP